MVEGSGSAASRDGSSTPPRDPFWLAVFAFLAAILSVPFAFAVVSYLDSTDANPTLFWIVLSLPLAAVVLGFIAVTGTGSRGLARAAIIIGLIELVLFCGAVWLMIEWVKCGEDCILM